MKRIYLDHIAATPLLPEALEAMLPFLKESYGNAQSLHGLGQEASLAVESAREKVAALINADPAGLIFTASGSEANNLAVKGLALARRDKGTHIVLTAIEHASVLNAARALEKLGFKTTLVPVDREGLVEPARVESALTKETVLVSVMLASAEVGTVEPVAAIASICRDRGIAVHSDAVAAVGNMGSEAPPR